MMTDIGLRTKILFYFVGLIFLSSLSTIFAVILATNSSVESQAQEKLLVGRKVFDQLLDIRASQLFDSAQVITSDFGFKTAVLTGDQSTIKSVLENHGARIGADLMMLASLDGELVAKTGDYQSMEFPFKSLLIAAEAEGGLSSTVVLEGKPYQILMLPIKAPITAAWTLVGFEMDLDLAQQLKELSDLEVSFTGSGSDGQAFELSTLAPADSSSKTQAKQATMMPASMSALENADTSEDWKLQQHADEEYIALVTPLIDNEQYHVSAILSTSLAQALQNFAPLKLQIMSIAMLALIVSSIVGFVLSKNITRPVNKLVHAAERISNGDYSVNVLDDRYKQNEIAKLANSVDQMQKGIAGREEQILHQAHHDTLTGLENRVAAHQRVTDLISELDNSPKPAEGVSPMFGMVLIDVRRFKAVNDTFGYRVGDRLLMTIAERLQGALKTPDSPARLGVNEFLVVLNGVTQEQILDKFHRLVDELTGTYQIESVTIRTQFYAGMALYPEHGRRTDQLLRRADIALNQAKISTNRAQVYQSGSDEKHLKQLRLVNDLKTAIMDDELTMHYQPKLDLKAGRITQVESLVRWIHPELGFIPPSEFIPLAEQSGLMSVLSRWVIKAVVREAAAWRDQGVQLQMAINLSAHDLANEDLPEFIASTLQEYGIRTSSFIFEVTESAMIDDPEKALDVLNRLKGLGLGLAVDDYGTGYSSLSQLKDMPVDELKIDMSFILKLDESRYDQAIVQSTIEMGHKLGLTIVAEGVENYESWQLLESWGCDKLQGYFISKPQASSDFIAWLENYQIPERAS